jgi:hypothetical protein
MRSARIHVRTAVAASFAALLLAGCSSTSGSDETIATAHPRPAPGGKYPDFSKPLTSATTQMSDEEAAQQQSQLAALASQRQAGRISAAEYDRRVQELRLLGQQAQQ